MNYWRHNWRYELSKRWERAVMGVAWMLPRSLVMWAFVRMTVEGCDGNPTDQTPKEIMDRWETAA